MSENSKLMSNRRLAFLIDTRYCNNCKTCEIACKMERKLPDGIRWREVRRFTHATQDVDYRMCPDGDIGIGNPTHKPFALSVAMACNHCESPKCVEVCPQNAYKKMPMGMVVQQNALCIGCSKCVAACPYSAPVYNKATNRTSKCDMCYDRLEAGMEPFCVKCCPNRALKLGIYEDLVAAYGAQQDLAGIDGGAIVPAPETNPSIVIKTF